MRRQQGFGLIGILVVVVVIAVLGTGGWLVWNAQQNKQSTQPSNMKARPSENAGQKSSVDTFKIPELGMEFDKKAGIEPKYHIIPATWNGVSLQWIYFSTDAVSAQGGACKDFRLISVPVYESRDDAIKVESDQRVNISFSESDMTAANGYITIGHRVVHVPQKIQAGTGACSDKNIDIESSQRVELRESLMSLRQSN